MIDPRDFLEAVSAKSQHDNPVRTNVLGFIDPDFNIRNYPHVKPRVEIPGQGLSHKGYTCINTYRPRPGDRVLLMPVGSDYVIVGSINVSEVPDLHPGTVVWEATYSGGSTTDSSGGTEIHWDVVNHDLVGSEQLRGGLERFQPGIPGWYAVSASMGWVAGGSSAGQRGLWIGHYTDEGLTTYNRVNAYNASGGSAVILATVPKLLYFNGTTDYATTRVTQVSGGTRDLYTSNGAGCFTATYQGASMPEEIVPPIQAGEGEDETPIPPDPNPTPTVKRFTKDYYPTWSATWSTGYGKGSSSREAYQGRYDTAGGYNYTKWGFNGATIRADLAGATVVSVHWQMKNLHSYSNSGLTVMLGTHNNSTEPGGSSSQSGSPNIYTYAQNKGATLNKSIPVSFGNALRDNTAQGIMIGHWNTGARDSRYGYFTRFGTNRPRLRIVYDKVV